jgi:pimeloyl-ACP methyl ester carboxylesterase
MAYRREPLSVTLHLFERVAVEDEGEGDPVVCVHGLGGSSNTWTPMMPALARHRVLRIDLPGSGMSQRAEGPLSIDRFVSAAAQACERLGVRQAHWLGHSLGTIVCQHLAVQHPGLVRSLALFGPLLAPADPARQALQDRAQRARSAGVEGMHAIAQQMVQAALSAHTRQHQPLVCAYVRDGLMRCDGAAYGRTCEALAEAQPAAVDRIHAPVLLVTGDEDGVAPPQAVRALADRLHAAASVRTEVLPRCGHWTPLERASDCARLWQDFAASVVRPAHATAQPPLWSRPAAAV